MAVSTPIALGIDLGTTYTVAAVIEDGRPKIIPNAEGQPLTPSVVTFTPEGKPLVGQPAKERAAANSQRTIFSIKRQMGSEHRVKVGEADYSPQEISGLILGKVRADAEAYLGTRIDQAVITVPAYFNDRQRQATRQAARLAGLEVLRLINEPTAAALAYGLHREEVHTVLVWDLGGGTFDVSILELGQGVFEVRAVSGDSWLGGDDYDRRLAELLAEEYRRRYGMEIPAWDGGAWQRLRQAAEKAKIELSRALTTRVSLAADGRAPPLELTLTRGRFEELTADLRQRMLPPTRQALADAGLRPHDIDRVILVGGATRMPAVRQLARELFGKEPYRYVDPDQVVALGAALQAGVLLGMVKQVVLLDVLPLSLGIETQGGLFAPIIPRNTPLPASEARIFTTAADGQTAVEIHVLQGERELAIYNISLGRFQLNGIPPLPRGTPKIEVAFEVDMDGIVHVSAVDLLTEGKKTIKVVSSKGLHPEEIEDLVNQAFANAATDEERRQTIEATLQAENLLSVAATALEQGDFLGSEASREEIERAVARAREALAGENSDEIRSQIEALRKLLGAWQPSLR